MFLKNTYPVFLSIFLIFSNLIYSQTTLTKSIEETLTTFGKKYANVGDVKISDFSANASSQKLVIKTNPTLSYLPLRPSNVDSIYAITKNMIQSEYPQYDVMILSEGRDLYDLIPGIYRKNNKSIWSRFSNQTTQFPLTKNLSQPFVITNGLQNRHIALWQSHGRYYNQTLQKWVWQRPVVFSTVEDLYTQSYVLPFLVPMLENSGAVTILPRERDTQTNEIIIDNDGSTSHSEFIVENRNRWKIGDLKGFGNLKKEYFDKENPFDMGTYLQTTTTKNQNEKMAVQWLPHFEEGGKYAVYVSYKTVPNSTQDARYTVFHTGGKNEFSVNQTMGGGTWIFLGFFHFKAGKHTNQGVFLSNYGISNDKIVTADAVKIGGGYGNIARKPADKEIKTYVGKGKKRKLKTSVQKFTNYSTSNYPRFTEGARYWLQWAGVPDSIYSRTEGSNDYSDDFQSRGFWVNYLAGGSNVIPSKKGLNVPVDLAFAFHSDAGTRPNDSIFGTLAIYTVSNNDKSSLYANGSSRWSSRELSDIVQTQIVEDIKKTFNPKWIRRGMWNRSYSESRVPEVPTMLLELLSHQNFGDMRYGHDPRFRFTVSRAIYKGILRYLAASNNFEYVVQPLPVQSFNSRFIDDSTVRLNWEETVDLLEQTAKATSYIVYTREADGDFDNGVVVNEKNYTRKIEKNRKYSFKVEALNKGGKSFPSEILSVYKAANNKPTILIVNGFNRISGPANFSVNGEIAGFNNQLDVGVPYLSDYSFTGNQTEFRRYMPYVSDNNVGFGASNKDYEDKVIAGNTFDYPSVHGNAIESAQFSYVSSSLKSVLDGKINMQDYKIVDLILGKEKQTFNLSDSTKIDFKPLTPELQKLITKYTQRSGAILISGSNFISDLVFASTTMNSERKFVENILKTRWFGEKISGLQKVTFEDAPIKGFENLPTMSFYATPNREFYFVEAPDIIEPNDYKAIKIVEYEQNGKSAGIVYKDKYAFCVLGFPIEAIKENNDRNLLMKSILEYFSNR
jgi:hypothetical protein